VGKKKLKLPMVEGTAKRDKKLFTSQPENTDKWQLKWDGEWQITYEVFRDWGGVRGCADLFMYW
jgi:hypothetical protein